MELVQARMVTEGVEPNPLVLRVAGRKHMGLAALVGNNLLAAGGVGSAGVQLAAKAARSAGRIPECGAGMVATEVWRKKRVRACKIATPRSASGRACGPGGFDRA